MKAKRTLYQLNWEILSAAEKVEHLSPNQPTPPALLSQIYSGNGMRLMNNPKPRNWAVTITTQAKADDGEIHTLTMQFKPDSAVTLSGLINWLKVRWIDECDEVLKGMTALQAYAVARCLA